MVIRFAVQPGAVVRHLAPVGGRVSAGDPVLVVETMKCENTVQADADGIVADLVDVGDLVRVGTRLYDVIGARP